MADSLFRGRSHEPDFTSFRKAIMLALALNDSLDDNDEWLQHANDMASEDVCESILEDLGDELRHMHCRGIDDAPDIWSHNDIIISRLAEAGFVDEDCTDNEWYSKDEDEETDDLDGSNEDTNGSEGESEQDTERRQVQNGPEDSDVEMTDAESG